ncbi:MAG: hypothetical protein WC891_06340 [Actinomycetota bacterium]
MDKQNSEQSKKDLLRAYKKARKPVAPPEKVIPDKREKEKEKRDEEEIKNA